MSKSIILTTDAPAPIGPYSQAIKSGNMLFCSGQVSLDPKTGEMKNTSIEEETRQALTNLSAVVSSGGATLSDVVKTTIFLTDLGNFATVNAIYDEFFGTSKPARSTVQVSGLPKGANVEIECIAII